MRADTHSRAAGARRLIALLELLARDQLPPAELERRLGIPRATLYRLRREAEAWGCVIAHTPAGWHIADWGVFAPAAFRPQRATTAHRA